MKLPLYIGGAGGASNTSKLYFKNEYTLKFAKFITIFIIYPRNKTFLVNSCLQRIKHLAQHLPRWPPNHLLNETIKISSIHFEI